jgi:hypothetical protein
MLTRITARVVAALVITGVSLGLVGQAVAAPQKAPTQAETLWMDRASNPNTNGF